jgi:uncharacterized protein
MKTCFLVCLSLLLCSAQLFSQETSREESTAERIMKVITTGDLPAAELQIREALKRNPGDLETTFLAAVCERNRFIDGSATPLFLKVINDHPDSTQALASACALGLDLAGDQTTALYYYNALVIVSRQNPRSIPISWLTGMMSRAITREHVYKKDSEKNRRILSYGIRQYENVLALMAPGRGPARIHQTMANLLDSANGFDAAWKHRQIALSMTREDWCLHGAACTLLNLDRHEEAIPLLKEALVQEPTKSGYHIALGFANFHLGRKKEAIQSWERAQELEEYGGYYFLLCALAQRDLGNYTEARKYSRRALERTPRDKATLIWDARFAAILAEPGAGERVTKAGTFDFQGNPTEPSPDPEPDPWFHALNTGDFIKVRQMMGTIDINAPHPKYKQTPLMLAACFGWEPIAADLIKAGAQLDLTDANGDTALHYTAQFAQPRVMKLLLDAGASLNIQDKWKQTPMGMSAMEFRPDGFHLLLAAKADVNLATPHGGNALHYATGHGRITRLQALIARGARIDEPTANQGLTPLMIACRQWPYPCVITPLLAAGGDVNAKDHDGRTALHHAVNPLLNLPLVDTLLEKGANPAQPDKEGITPIAQARLLGFESIAKQMEAKAGKPEPFQFPKFELPDATLSPESKNAAYYVFPILLAQGHPLGRAVGARIGEKRSAIRELRWMFEIENAEELKDEIRELEAFEPRHRNEAGTLPAETSLEILGKELVKKVEKIQASCKKDAIDETAWVKSHIIYLADLGVAAEYMSEAEATKLIQSSSSVLKSQFASWPDFIRSFLLGAAYHNAWEADRYEQVCQRLLEGGVPWP